MTPESVIQGVAPPTHLNSSVRGNWANHPNQNARFAGSRAPASSTATSASSVTRYTRPSASAIHVVGAVRTRDDHERVTRHLGLEHRTTLEEVD